MSSRMGDELALALEGRVATASHEVARLVVLAGALAAVPGPEIDPAFASRLEARLMAERIEESQATARPALAPVRAAAVPARPAAPELETRRARVIPLPRRRFVVRRSLVAAVAAAMLVALPMVAGANSLPGSPLFPVRQAIERVQLALTFDETAKGFRQIEYAKQYQQDAEQLVGSGASSEDVKAALAEMQRHAREGATRILRTSDPRHLTRLASSLRPMVEALANLVPSATKGALPALQAAIQEGKDLIREVVAALGFPPVVASPVTDVAGGTAEVSEAGSATASSASTTDAQTSTATSPTPDSPQGPTPPGPAPKPARPGDCGIPGRANGLGNALEPVAEIFCG